MEKPSLINGLLTTMFDSPQSLKHHWQDVLTDSPTQTLVEIPAFFVEEIIAAYPNATFIHVDRDVDKWVTSMTNVLGTVEPLLDATPMKLMATYDLFIRRYISLHVMLFSVLYHGRKSSDPVGQKMLKDDYLAL